MNYSSFKVNNRYDQYRNEKSMNEFSIWAKTKGYKTMTIKSVIDRILSGKNELTEKGTEAFDLWISEEYSFDFSSLDINLETIETIETIETKVEETKVEETKVEETKVEETKVEETKVEETKVEETNYNFDFSGLCIETENKENTIIETTEITENKVIVNNREIYDNIEEIIIDLIRLGCKMQPSNNEINIKLLNSKNERSASQPAVFTNRKKTKMAITAIDSKYKPCLGVEVNKKESTPLVRGSQWFDRFSKTLQLIYISLITVNGKKYIPRGDVLYPLDSSDLYSEINQVTYLVNKKYYLFLDTKRNMVFLDNVLIGESQLLSKGVAKKPKYNNRCSEPFLNKKAYEDTKSEISNYNLGDIVEKTYNYNDKQYYVELEIVEKTEHKVKFLANDNLLNFCQSTNLDYKFVDKLCNKICSKNAKNINFLRSKDLRVNPKTVEFMIKFFDESTGDLGVSQSNGLKMNISYKSLYDLYSFFPKIGNKPMFQCLSKISSLSKYDKKTAGYLVFLFCLRIAMPITTHDIECFIENESYMNIKQLWSSVINKIDKKDRDSVIKELFNYTKA